MSKHNNKSGSAAEDGSGTKPTFPAAPVPNPRGAAAGKQRVRLPLPIDVIRKQKRAEAKAAHRQQNPLQRTDVMRSLVGMADFRAAFFEHLMSCRVTAGEDLSLMRSGNDSDDDDNDHNPGGPQQLPGLAC